ncbi:MAG: hypothetical protein JKY34_08660 [Kordiimonadaceae bacterium]|nr:hypothetical protein [Kordiimonadaceae bacterium]
MGSRLALCIQEGEKARLSIEVVIDAKGNAVCESRIEILDSMMCPVAIVKAGQPEFVLDEMKSTALDARAAKCMAAE